MDRSGGPLPPNPGFSAPLQSPSHGPARMGAMAAQASASAGHTTDTASNAGQTAATAKKRAAPAKKEEQGFQIRTPTSALLGSTRGKGSSTDIYNAATIRIV